MQEFRMSQLKPGAHVHMIGIGGISMSALAHMLMDFGFRISGSDAKASNLTDDLAAARDGLDHQIGADALLPVDTGEFGILDQQVAGHGDDEA